MFSVYDNWSYRIIRDDVTSLQDALLIAFSCVLANSLGEYSIRYNDTTVLILSSEGVKRMVGYKEYEEDY